MNYRKPNKRTLYIVMGGAILLSSIAMNGYYFIERPTRKVNVSIKKELSQYEIEQKQRLEDRTNELKRYLNKKILENDMLEKRRMEQNYETKVPLEELAKVFGCVYKISNDSYYSTKDGKLLKVQNGIGSGMLFKGGYMLTAKHVVETNSLDSIEDYIRGTLKFHHDQISIENGKYNLEEILQSKEYDYAIYKLKGENDLLPYQYGINIPNKLEIGMRSVVIGYSVGIKNLKLGNVSQIEGSESCGKEYILFKNSIINGDSGGPIFVIENGRITLAAIANRIVKQADNMMPFIMHNVDIGCGLKAGLIIEDIKKQTQNAYLHDAISAELRDFLRYNK